MKNLDLLVIIVAVIVWAVFVQVHNAGLRDDQAATIKSLQSEVEECSPKTGESMT